MQQIIVTQYKNHNSWKYIYALQIVCDCKITLLLCDKLKRHWTLVNANEQQYLLITSTSFEKSAGIFASKILLGKTYFNI